MQKIILSLMLIAGTGAILASGATGAFFSDTETSTGNTFTAGVIDLKIDNESYYNGNKCEQAPGSPEWTWQGDAPYPVPGTPCTTSWLLDELNEGEITLHKFFDFLDLKPDDWGEDTISLHVDTNDSYLCADITLTSNNDNGLTEPESSVDQTDGIGAGELAQNVHFLWWADDGDNVLEDNENVISQGPIGALPLNQPYPIPLADSTTNIWTGIGGPVPGDETLYIGKAWCFGAIAPAPLAQDNIGVNNPRNPSNSSGGISCDGTLLDNSTQTDSLTADVTFKAVQARHNDTFICDRPKLACTPEQAYADTVVVADQGRRKNGTAITADRIDPTKVLGAPQSLGTFYDNPVVPNSFFSLGFGTGTTSTRSIVVAFQDNIIVDGPGNDLKVWEVTGGTNYPDEHVKVEVSQDGSTWFTAVADLTRDAEADLATSGLTWAKYVRLTDISPIGPFEATADGYDLDAFSALNCEQTPG